MERVSIADLDSSDETGIDRRGLSGPLNATDVAINRYRLGPSDGLPGGLHAHMDQEEVFVVIEGEATFSTMEGTVVVDTGEAIRFAPGEFQSGKNESDGDLVLVAIGAPRHSEDVRLPLACPECRHDDMRLDSGDNGVAFVCPACSTERVPKACPGCGNDDMRVALGEGARTVVVCSGCGVEFDDPPVQGRW